MEKTPIVQKFPLHWSDEEEEEDLFHERTEDVEDIESLTQPIERPLAGKFFILFTLSSLFWHLSILFLYSTFI